MMAPLTVTVDEDARAERATLVLSPDDAARLGLAVGQTVTLEVQPEVSTADDEDFALSDANFEAIKQEIATLAAHDNPWRRLAYTPTARPQNRDARQEATCLTA